jgi:hypothetical protein
MDKLDELEETVVRGSLNLTITNTGRGGRNGCDPRDLAIWIGVDGPESQARIATPSSTGECSWRADFGFTLPGKYAITTQLLFWAGRQDRDDADCKEKEGEDAVWELEDSGAAESRDPAEILFSFVGSQLTCCEICTRDPSCTHYSRRDAGRGGVPYGFANGAASGKRHECIIFSNRSGFVTGLHPLKTPSTGGGDEVERHKNMIRSGVSRTDSPAHYIGSGYGWMVLDCHASEATVDPDHIARTFFVSVPPSSAAGSPSIARTYDQRAIRGATVAESEASGQLCEMTSQSLPHVGRWLDISELLAGRGVHATEAATGGESMFCFAASSSGKGPKGKPFTGVADPSTGADLDLSAAPIEYVGFVRGSKLLKAAPPAIGLPLAKYLLGHHPFYYYQPYACDYHHYSRDELRSCLADRGITNFAVQGDSLMMGAGTGFVPVFRELLGNMRGGTYKEGGALEMEMLDPDFRFHGIVSSNNHELFGNGNSGGFDVEADKRNANRLLVMPLKSASNGNSTFSGCPHVIVTNFWLNHKMWWQNMSDTKRSVAHEVAMVERAVAQLPAVCKRDAESGLLLPAPLKFFMTPVVYTSERQNHLTTEHSVEITAWLEREFIPQGWVALDYGRLHIARSLDSCCNGDGLHPAHNSRAMLAQMLANQLCRGKTAPSSSSSTGAGRWPRHTLHV